MARTSGPTWPVYSMRLDVRFILTSSQTPVARLMRTLKHTQSAHALLVQLEQQASQLGRKRGLTSGL